MKKEKLIVVRWNSMTIMLVAVLLGASPIMLGVGWKLLNNSKTLDSAMIGLLVVIPGLACLLVALFTTGMATYTATRDTGKLDTRVKFWIGAVWIGGLTGLPSAIVFSWVVAYQVLHRDETIHLAAFLAPVVGGAIGIGILVLSYLNLGRAIRGRSEGRADPSE